MPRPRARWWLYIVSASFLAYAAVTNYCWYLGVEPHGFSSEFRGTHMIVKQVFPSWPAARAGLAPGDQVLALDGQAIGGWSDLRALVANWEVGSSYPLEVERAGERRVLTLTPGHVHLRWSPGEAALFAIQLSRLFMLLVGLVIAFSRPHDPVASLGGLLLAILGVYDLALPPGFAATWRHLPWFLGALLWLPQLSVSLCGPVGLTFFSSFPRKLFRAPWLWTLVWLPALLLILPWNAYYTFHLVYRPTHVTGILPGWLLTTRFVVLAGYAGVGATVLGLNYRRLEDTNERRRLRVVLVGFLGGIFPQLPLLLSALLPPVLWRSVFGTVPYFVLRAFLFLAFPLSVAYAILRYRLFDIRVMIRRGLQYALARRVVLSLVPALAGVLALDLLLHGNQPLTEILRARGWVYGLLGGLAVLAHYLRQQWLAALDRRFFRERYDAERLLREVVEEVHAARSFDQVAPRVVARIEAALHPQFAALLVREPREPSFRTLSAAPAGHAPPRLPADSKLVALVRVLGKPIEMPHTESGWLQQQLPHEETDFIRQAGIDLLVPVSFAPERSEALLALGVKRSEEPYTREDQELLISISNSLDLLLERPVTVPVHASEAFEECPRCGACYDTGAACCPQEGAGLHLVHVPRLLAARYRLDCRLGRGGMGTVYAATDTALDRRVAVKLIRDDLVGSAEAAERFRRESRAAASFSHPNVVTVHDFGVAAATRAFLVMELLDGHTLREELKREKRLAARRTLEVLRGVTAAVDAAHRRQLIHRDLKPENIFLARDEDGETAKILDFGIAKFLPSATGPTADTGTGLLVGTLYYMAPEQLRGEHLHASWDLWALAVIAYEMLTGTHPFAAGGTAVECQAALLAGRATLVAFHLPESPARWQEFFDCALALEPTRRPASARLFCSELDRALA